MGKHFIRTEHFRQRCQERQVSEVIVEIIERELALNAHFQLHKQFQVEDKIVVVPPFYCVHNPHRPYLVIVRKGKVFVTTYWICAEKFIKIIQQEPYFYLNLDNPYENSSYYIV
jgi:hypothetical protein